MENPTQTDPQGGADVTASSGQSGDVVTQPAEPTGSVDGAKEGETGTQYPWESDERFKGKSPDDIWKTYQEAQKVIGQSSQKAELSNLLEKHTGMSAGEIKAFLQKQEQQKLQEKIQADPANYALEKVAALESQIALQNEEKALDGYLNSEEGKAYAPFRQQIMEAAFYMPTMQDKTYDVIAKTLFGNAIAQGQQTAYQKIETKKQTQATGAGNAQVTKPGLEDLMQLPRSERIKALETILPHS